MLNKKVLIKIAVFLLGLGILLLMLPVIFKSPTWDNVGLTSFILILFWGFALGFETQLENIIYPKRFRKSEK